MDTTQTNGFLWYRDSLITGVRWHQHVMHEDKRGSFTEAFRNSAHPEGVVQVNVSISKCGVIRGMHWHEHQWDHWYLAQGEARVVLMDMRGGTVVDFDDLVPGDGVSIPPRVAHGFQALTDMVLVYGVTKEYDRSEPDEQGFHYLSVPLGHLWSDMMVLSERDWNAPYHHQRP